MARVVLYGTRFCPYCVAARQWLRDQQVEFDDIAVDGDQATRSWLQEQTGQRTVPQIWIGDTHVGGYTDLMALARSGAVEKLLAADSGSDGRSGDSDA